MDRKALGIFAGGVLSLLLSAASFAYTQYLTVRLTNGLGILILFELILAPIGVIFMAAGVAMMVMKGRAKESP